MNDQLESFNTPKNETLATQLREQSIIAAKLLLENTDFLQENLALKAQIDALKKETRDLKEQALLERDFTMERAAEVIRINGWQARILYDHENTYRFEIYDAECNYVESEGGFESSEKIEEVATDLLHLYSTHKPEPVTKIYTGDKIVNLDAWTFEVETTIQSTLILPGENYEETKQRLLEIYKTMDVNFSNRRVGIKGSEHVVKSSMPYEPY